MIADLQRLLELRHPRLLVVALAVNAALIIGVANTTLRRFPNSGDEYAYLVSATLFAQGRLHVTSPEPRAFFDVSHVVNDGRFYGKYPPGWPVVLSLFVRLGAPWLANLLLGLTTLVVIDCLARRHFSQAVANVTAVLSIACPFLVFNSASLFSHPLCLLCLALTTWAFLECQIDPNKRRWFVGLGSGLGFAFLTRPINAIVAGTVLGAFSLVRIDLRWSTFWRRIFLIAAPCLLLHIAAFLVYNQSTTGDWLVQPFARYDPTDTFGFHREPISLVDRLNQNVLQRIIQLQYWAPFLPLIAVTVFLPGRSSRIDPKQVLLLLLPLIALLAFIPYWGDGGNQYGPRYLYETLFALLLLSAGAIVRFQSVGIWLILLVVVFNFRAMTDARTLFKAQVRERMTLFDLVEASKLENAVVFVGSPSGTMDPGDLIRNGTRFDGPVIFARDRDRDNEKLLARFPERAGYRFTYHPRSGLGSLRPWVPTRKP